MKRLLHCIFRNDPAHAELHGEPDFSVVSSRHLAVATSAWRDDDGSLAMPRLQAYARTIATAHASRTVIPLRFGCVLDGQPEIRRLLEGHAAEFMALLDRLEGLAEMGLRIWDSRDEPARLEQLGPGTRYLAAARSRHGSVIRPEEQCVSDVTNALAGLYVDQKAEACPAAGGRLISFHFLVPKTRATEFRNRVRCFAGERKCLVSGPWPPYHFVDSVWR